MAVELYIKRSGATEYTTVPVKDGTTIEINKSIDIETQVNNLTNEWTKTITVPASPTVNQLFSHIYDLRIFLDTTTTFDPNKRSDVLIVDGGLPFFKGFAQLIEVKSDLYGVIEYELACFGESVNLISRLESVNVRDLDWSDLDHVFDSGILTTWESGSVTMGSGYVYPMIDYSGKQASPGAWQLTDFYPAVFIKEIWDRAFEEAGFTYQSDFVTSDRFKSFIMPYAGKFEALTQADASGKHVSVSRTSTAQDIVPNSSASGSTKLIFNNEIQDPFNNYNSSTGAFTVDFLNPFCFIRLNNCAVIPTVTNTWAKVFATLRLARKRSNVWTTLETLALMSHHNPSFPSGQLYTSGTPYSLSLDIDPLHNTDFSFTFLLTDAEQGDEFYLFIDNITATAASGSTTQPSTTSFNFRLSIGSTAIFIPPTGARTYGDNYQINWNFPTDYKASSFITDIVRMFNLILYPHPTDDKKLIVEPYSDFFGNDIVDWSDKLDQSQPLKSKPLSMSTAKTYVYSYKDGGDKLNKVHRDTYGTTFGRRVKTTANQFTKEEKKTDVNFIPSVLTRGKNVDRYHIAAYEGDTNLKPSPGLRILIYRPEVATINSFTVGFQGVTETRDFYPYAGTLDNPDNPTYDLNFGLPEAIYYVNAGSFTITNNNLYRNYYSGKINQLTSINSRTVEGVFKLGLTDIINLDFRKRYAFKGQTFRLLSVNGFQPNGNGLTPCRFINDELAASDTIVSAISNGGSDVIGQEPSPGFVGDPDPIIINFGSNNLIAPEAPAALIVGDNNTIGASRVTLLNCNNIIVPAGLEVTAIDCNDITLTRSGTYVSNNYQPKAGAETFVLESGNTDATASEGIVNFIVSTDDTTCTLYVDPIPGAIYSLSYNHIHGSVLFVKDYNNVAILDENTDGLYYFSFDGTTYTRLN